MPEIPENMLYEGVSVDIRFSPPGPLFGDLFQICGEDHPRFPPSGLYRFGQLADLQFSQVDDSFGVHSLAGEGDDVIVWLYPLVKRRVVDHHPGPFDAIRLAYCVLRNSVRHVDLFLHCVEAFASVNPADIFYVELGRSLGVPPDISPIRADIEQILAYWRDQGIETGSERALTIDH